LETKLKPARNETFPNTLSEKFGGPVHLEGSKGFSFSPQKKTGHHQSQTHGVKAVKIHGQFGWM